MNCNQKEAPPTLTSRGAGTTREIWQKPSPLAIGTSLTASALQLSISPETKKLPSLPWRASVGAGITAGQRARDCIAIWVRGDKNCQMLLARAQPGSMTPNFGFMFLDRPPTFPRLTLWGVSYFATQFCDTHWRIQDRIDFWPSTGRWADMKATSAAKRNGCAGKGIADLIAYLRAEVPTGEMETA